MLPLQLQTLTVSIFQLFDGKSVTTNAYGIAVGDVTDSTNAYGLTLNVSSGTNKWNLYSNGTASNYLAGKLMVGATTTNNTQLIAVNTDSDTTSNSSFGLPRHIKFNQCHRFW